MVLVQLSNGLNSLGIDTNGGVAWFAHIGGFIAGVSSVKYIQNYKLKTREQRNNRNSNKNV